MNGLQMVGLERIRQINKGFDSEHDQQHVNGEIIQAALCYLAAGMALAGGNVTMEVIHSEEHLDGVWPWEFESWSPDPDPAQNYVKAAALITAEVDRLQAK